MKKFTFFLLIGGLCLLCQNCLKKSDPAPEIKDPYAMFNYTIQSDGIVSFTNTSENATSYLWNFGDLTTSTTSEVTFEHQYLQNGSYHATLTAYGNGNSAGAYADLNITSVVSGSLPTVETNSITNITQTTASSGGNITSEGNSAVTARGVCWSLTQNPTISDSKTNDGSGTGGFNSNITGLTSNTPYYVRAYATNNTGTAYGSQLSFNTTGSSGGQPCPGIPTITINHVAGAVAPFSKTVTYGTVINIPGKPTHCWITSNLGADHQATSVDDMTEESAGWYWQFNRKQGYKHDGAVRTPNTNWITSIDENEEWQKANDPCRIELGGDWRIPTWSEWWEVDDHGSWSDWNGPWNSDLKLHAAGYLMTTDGSLEHRGSWGSYWSNRQYSFTRGNCLHFDNGNSYTTSNQKEYGFTLRCIKGIEENTGAHQATLKK